MGTNRNKWRERADVRNRVAQRGRFHNSGDEMLSRRVGRKFSSRGICAVGIAGLGILLACEAKERPVATETGNTTFSNQPSPAPNEPNSTQPAQSPAEGQQANPETLVSGEQPGELPPDDDCSDADGGVCAPVPLCEGDAGTCEATCPGCFIDGVCVAAQAIEEGSSCHVCDPERDPRGWSNNDGATCDDGLFCTIDDVCRGGSCVGAARNCDDGVACNGVATCLEDSDACSAPVNQCGNNAVCDVATDSCKSTCDGCIVAGVCVGAGTEAPGNPCQVCDPTSSATGYTIAAGKSCGAAATACSGQDTCDAQGRCQANHLAAGTSCGNSASSACDQADTCDGNGNCQQQLAPNGTSCDDGAFCTVGDQCQGGRCVATGNQNCGANRVCNEGARQCQCQGCQIGNSCVARGATNPTNACQICDPARSATAYVANAGAQCGSPASECSGQDTCNTQGQCVANDLAAGTACSSVPGGTCQGGQCVAPRQANGAPCTSPAQCLSGFCRPWFLDIDGDAFGSGASQMLCSPSPDQDQISAKASGLIIAILADSAGRKFSSRGDDCCDSLSAGGNSVFPQNTNLLTIPQRACPNVKPFDYNCDGLEIDQTNNALVSQGCDSLCNSLPWVTLPQCGQLGDYQQCRLVNGTCTLDPPSQGLRACQ
jgi:hypothetical protein